MAEADALIFAALQQSGIIPARALKSDSWTVSDLTSDEFLALVHEFLMLLKSVDTGATFSLPSIDAKAPMSVAAKHRVGLRTADILKGLGYAGDCSYHHVLYPSERKTRNILTWIMSKLPRASFEESEEIEREDFLDSTRRRTGGWQGDTVLEPKSLRDVFVNWKREKTLYMLPNQHVEGLQGFQRLPLQTYPLELPWNRSIKSTRRLFEDFPSMSVKLTSLLEALSVEKCSSTILLHEDEFEEEVNSEAVDLLKDQGHASGLWKGDTGAGESGCLVLQETNMIGDKNAAVRPLSSIGTALPEIPMSLDVSTPESTDLYAEENNMLETGQLNFDDTSEGGRETSADQIVETEEQLLDKTQEQVNNTKLRLAAMQKVLHRERDELHQTEQRIVETQIAEQELQKQLARRKQLLEMLPDAPANIAKLKSNCKMNAAKKEKVARQMKVARGPLLKEYNELRNRISSQKARRRQLVYGMKTFQTEMQKFSDIVHSKVEILQTLEKDQERQKVKLGKKEDCDGGVVTRSAYTSRIMDIIKQVHKQKQDITKVLEDITTLQKQLDAALEKRKRAGAVADETIYCAASKSKSFNGTKADAYVECYRKFAQVRELFEELIVAVDDAGKKENAARDLQNWISQLEVRESGKHLNKVLADIESVRDENVTLQNELLARVGQ